MKCFDTVLFLRQKDKCLEFCSVISVKVIICGRDNYHVHVIIMVCDRVRKPLNLISPILENVYRKKPWTFLWYIMQQK